MLNKIHRLRAEQARFFKRTKNLFYFDLFVFKLSLSVYLISIFHASIGKLKLEVLISEFWDENEFVVISEDYFLLCCYPSQVTLWASEEIQYRIFFALILGKHKSYLQ